MRCPRCKATLTTYTLGESDTAAINCESCGFAGVSASHHGERDAPETWDTALGRFDNTGGSENTTQTARIKTVSDPPTAEPATLDGDTLDSTGVSVAGLLARPSQDTLPSSELVADTDEGNAIINSEGADEDSTAEIQAVNDESTAGNTTDISEESGADPQEEESNTK